MQGQPKEIHIKSNSSWFYFNFRELYDYRDLIFVSVRRDFVSKYKQTILGPSWFVINPIFTTLVYSVIFGNIAQLSTDGIPDKMFYFTGIMVWEYFSTNLSQNSNIFLNHANVFTKIYFPRMIVSFVSLVNTFIGFAVQLLTFTGFYIYYKFFTSAGDSFGITPYIFLAPLMMLQLFAIAIGVGYWASCLTAKYRDLGHVFRYVTNTWMYLTPIIYPSSIVPDNFKILYNLNPLISVFEVLKMGFLGVGQINLYAYAYSVCFTVVIFVSGVLLFQRTQRTFADAI